MATQSQTRLFQLILKMMSSCKYNWQKLHAKIHSVKTNCSSEPIPCVDEMPKSTSVMTQQWPLNDDINAHHYAVIKEVEFYPYDAYENKDHKTTLNLRNYTVEGDDPNRRITHFPPSNRLH